MEKQKELKEGRGSLKGTGKGIRNRWIDYMKFIAAFLVVAIHVSPLSGINETGDFILTRIIARIAVPFFFMVSGYFVLSGSRRHNKKALKFLKKTCLLYLAAMVLYLPVNVYTGYFKELKAGTVLKDIFLDGTFYHLWYLPAVMLGILICLFLIRIMQEKAAFVITVILYLAGLLGDSYYGLTRQFSFLGKAYDGILQVFSYTRNGIFFAPVFLMLGCLIRNGEKAEERDKGSKNRAGTDKTDGHKTDRHQTNSIVYGLLVLVFFLPMLAEGLLLHQYGWQRHDSMYLFLLPLMYFFFLFLLSINEEKRVPDQKQASNPKKASDQKQGEGRSIVMGNMAMIIYIIHPMVLILLRGVSKKTGLYGILVENALVCYFAVSLLSALGAWILLFIYKIFSGGFQKTSKIDKEEITDLDRDRAWVEIDLEHLKWNVERIKEMLPEGCRFMAVVKADAYGHGSLMVSKYLCKTGIRAFAVATLEEGIYLREHGVRGKILILGYTSPINAPYLAKYHLVQTVADEDYAEKLNAGGIPVKVHIGVDTGMHRLGEDYRNKEKIAEIFHYENLEVEGIYSHLCVSDNREEWAASFTKKQIERFYGVVDFLQERGEEDLKTHLQSSYGVVNYPGLPVSYARVGIMMYGCLSGGRDETSQSLDLKEVLTLKARVALVRTLKKGESLGYGCDFLASGDTRVAVVTIGYGDGYPRSLSGKNQDVLIHGERAKIIGRICMDQLMADITGIDGVRPGDEVTLIGRDGAERISAEEVADHAGTITNELLSRLGSRLKRPYAG